MAQFEDEIVVGSGPRTLQNGESNTYLDNGNLITETNIDGTVYTNTSASDDSPSNVVKTLENFEFSDESIGGSNFSIDLGDNAILIKDDQDNVRTIVGQISTGGYGFQSLDQNENELFGIYGTTANLAGWSVTQAEISKTAASGTKTISIKAGDEPRLNLAAGSTTILKAGMLSGTSVGFALWNSGGSEVLRIDDTGTTEIAGWQFTTQKFQSAGQNNTRIELDSNKARVSVVDSSNNTKTAMGYLGGLKKNNSVGLQINAPSGSGNSATVTIPSITNAEHDKAFSPNGLTGLTYYIADSSGNIYGTGGSSSNPGGTVTSNTYNTITLSGTAIHNAINSAWNGPGLKHFFLQFTNDDYGFWVAEGDRMQIDGDVSYESGDWLIESDGALKFLDGSGNEIMRLGTLTGEKGLFIGSDVDSTTPLASYTGSKILIGDESAQYMKYTTAGGLEINGDITVEGDTSTQAYETFKNIAVGTNVSNYLDSAKWNVIGNFLAEQTATGLRLEDSVTDNAWDSCIRWKEGFKSANTPVLTWDFKVVHSHQSQQSIGEMIGWFDDNSNANYTNIEYGVYIYQDDMKWFGPGNSTDGDIYTGDVNMTGTSWRLVIKLKSGGGAIGHVYKDGDFTTPYATNIFTKDSEQEPNTFYIGNTVYNTGTPKIEHQQMACGVVTPSVPTVISGGLISTGKIESTDSRTFFDLNESVIQMSDGTNPRVQIGDVTQGNYAMKISSPGVDVTSSAATNDNLLFSSEWAIPKYTGIYASTPNNRAGSETFMTETKMEEMTFTNDGIDGAGTSEQYVQANTYYRGYINANTNMSGNGSNMWKSATKVNDTTKSWRTNELVGMWIINHRQGHGNAPYGGGKAFGKITANTSNQITTTSLTGGEDAGATSYNNDGSGKNHWNYSSNGGGQGDFYSIVHHHFGVLDSSELGYYVGKRRIQTSYSMIHEPGVTLTTVPYLHDKNNKFLRLSCFLTPYTVLRFGIFNAAFGTTDNPQIELMPAGVLPLAGDNQMWVEFINDITNQYGSNTLPNGLWFYTRANSNSTSQDYWMPQYIHNGNKGSYSSWSQIWGQNIHHNYFKYLHDQPFIKQAYTSSTGSYKILNINLESNSYSTQGLKHGDEYIIKIWGGRNHYTEYDMDNTDGTAGRHRIVLPKLTVHGYNYNASGGNDST